MANIKVAIQRKLQSTTVIEATLFVNINTLVFIPHFDILEPEKIFNYISKTVAESVETGQFSADMNAFAAILGVTETAYPASISEIDISYPNVDIPPYNKPPVISAEEYSGIGMGCAFILFFVLVFLYLSYIASKPKLK